jgi:prepilin-type N-terminal cleavage/methylation domain-containing protein
MMKHRHDSGFTLVETLVALVVLGFIIVGLAQGLRFGMIAWGLQTKTIAGDSAMDTTDRTLRRLLAGMEPGYDPHHPASQVLGLCCTGCPIFTRNGLCRRRRRSPP